MLTSNEGPWDAPEPLRVTDSLVRVTNQTRPATPATNNSAIIISDVFVDFFMPLKITVDRDGGQVHKAGIQRPICRLPRLLPTT